MSFVSGGSESSTSRLRLSRGKVISSRLPPEQPTLARKLSDAGGDYESDVSSTFQTELLAVLLGGDEDESGKSPINKQASATRAAAAQKENVDPSSASGEESFSLSYENEEDEDLHHVKGRRRQPGTSRRTRRADAGAPPTSEQYGIPSTRRPLPRFVLRAEKKEKPPPREVHYDGLFVFYKDIEDKDEAKRQQELARQRQVKVKPQGPAAGGTTTSSAVSGGPGPAPPLSREEMKKRTMEQLHDALPEEERKKLKEMRMREMKERLAANKAKAAAAAAAAPSSSAPAPPPPPPQEAKTKRKSSNNKSKEPQTVDKIEQIHLQKLTEATAGAVAAPPTATASEPAPGIEVLDTAPGLPGTPSESPAPSEKSARARPPERKSAAAAAGPVEFATASPVPEAPPAPAPPVPAVEKKKVGAPAVAVVPANERLLEELGPPPPPPEPATVEDAHILHQDAVLRLHELAAAYQNVDTDSESRSRPSAAQRKQMKKLTEEMKRSARPSAAQKEQMKRLTEQIRTSSGGGPGGPSTGAREGPSAAQKEQMAQLAKDIEDHHEHHIIQREFDYAKKKNEDAHDANLSDLFLSKVSQTESVHPERKTEKMEAHQEKVQALAAASAEFEAARGEAHHAVHNLQKAVRVTARISALPKDERPEALQKLEEHAIAQEKAFQQEQKAEEALEQERASLRQFCVAEVVSSTKAEHAQHTHVPHDTFRRKARIAAMTRIMTRRSSATKSSGALSPGSPSVGQQSNSGAESSRKKESTLAHAAHEGAAGAGEADVSQLLQMRKTKQHSAEDVNAGAAGGPAQRVGEGSGIYDHVEEGEDHGAALRSSSAGYGGQHPFAFRDGLDANLTRLNLSAYPIQQARLGKHNHLKTGGRTSGVMIGTSGTGRSRGSARAPSPFEQLFFGPGGRPPSSRPTPGSNMMLLGPLDVLPDQQFGLGSSPSMAEAEAARGGGVLGEAAAPARPAQQVYPTPTISEQLMGGGRLNAPTSPSFYVPDQRGEVSPRDRVKALRGGLFGIGTKAGGQERERAGGVLHGQAHHEGSIDQLQALATPTSPSFMPPVDQRSGLHVHVQPLHAPHGASPRSVQVEAGHLAGISRVAASQLKKIKSGSSSGSGSRSPVPSDSGLLSDQEKLEMLRQKKAALIAAAQEQAAVGDQLPQHRSDTIGKQHGEVAHPHVGSQHHDAVDPTQKIKLDGRHAREQRMVSSPGSAKERQKVAPVPHADPELKQKLALPPTLHQIDHSVVAASGTRESRGQDHTVHPAEDVARKQNLLLNHPPPEKNKKKRDRSRSRSTERSHSKGKTVPAAAPPPAAGVASATGAGAAPTATERASASDQHGPASHAGKPPFSGAAAGDNEKDKVDKRAHRVTSQERLKALHDRTNRVHQQDAIGFHGEGAIPAFHVAAAKTGSYPTSAKDPEERTFYTAHERAEDLPKTSDEEAAHGDPRAAPDAEKKRSPSAHDGTNVTPGLKGAAAAATSAVKQVLGGSAAAAHEYLFGGRSGETQTPQTRSSAAEKVLHPQAGHDQQNDDELQELLEIEQMEKRLRDQNARLRETLEHTQKDVKQDWDVLKTALKAEDAVAEVEHEKSVAEVQKLSEEAKRMAEATKGKWEAAEKELGRSASAGGVGVGGRRRRARVTSSKAADRGDGGSSASGSSRASSRKRRNRNRKKLKLGKNIAIEHGGDAEVSRLEAAGVVDSVGGMEADAAADAKGKDASAGGATLADGRAPGVEAAGDLDASDSIDSPHLLGPRPAGTKPMNLDELKQAAAKRTAKKKARRARSRSRSGSRRRKRGRSDPIKRGGTISSAGSSEISSLVSSDGALPLSSGASSLSSTASGRSGRGRRRNKRGRGRRGGKRTRQETYKTAASQLGMRQHPSARPSVEKIAFPGELSDDGSVSRSRSMSSRSRRRKRQGRQGKRRRLEDIGAPMYSSNVALTDESPQKFAQSTWFTPGAAAAGRAYSMPRVGHHPYLLPATLDIFHNRFGQGQEHAPPLSSAPNYSSLSLFSGHAPGRRPSAFSTSAAGRGYRRSPCPAAGVRRKRSHSNKRPGLFEDGVVDEDEEDDEIEVRDLRGQSTPTSARRAAVPGKCESSDFAAAMALRDQRLAVGSRAKPKPAENYAYQRGIVGPQRGVDSYSTSRSPARSSSPRSPRTSGPASMRTRPRPRSVPSSSFFSAGRNYEYVDQDAPDRHLLQMPMTGFSSVVVPPPRPPGIDFASVLETARARSADFHRHLLKGKNAEEDVKAQLAKWEQQKAKKHLEFREHQAQHLRALRRARAQARDGLLTPAAARFVVQRLHQEHEAEAAIIRREIEEIEEKMLSKLQPTGSKAFDVMLKHDVEFLPADNDTTTKVLAELKLGNPYVAQNFDSGFVNLLGKEVAVETEAGQRGNNPDAEEIADAQTQAQTNSPAAGGPRGRTSGMSMEEEMLEELRTTGIITTRHDHATKFYQEPRTSASSRPANVGPANVGPEEEQLLESYRTARASLTKARKTLMALAGTPNAGKVFQQISEMKKRERQLKQDEEHLLRALKLATTVAYAEERWQELLNDPNNDAARQFDGKLALYVEEVGFLKEELARLQEAKHLADSELNVVRLSSPGSTSGLSAAERDWQAESDRLGEKIAVVEEEKGKLEEKMLAHANPGTHEPPRGGPGSSSSTEEDDKGNVDADRDHDANPRDPKSPISMEAKKEIAAAFRDMVEAGTLREQVLADTENSGLRKELLAGLHFTDAERWFIEEKLSAHNVAAATASTGAAAAAREDGQKNHQGEDSDFLARSGEVDPITVVNAVARKKERMLNELLGHVRADLREVGEAKEQSRQELEAMGITEKSFANALMHMQLDGRKVKTLLDELAQRGVSEEDVDGWMALAGAAPEGGEVAEFERGVADGDVWTALQTASGTRNKNEKEDQQIPAVVPFVPDTTPPAARVQDRYTPPDQVTQVLSFDGKPKTDAAGRRFVYEPGTLRSFYLEREPVFHIKTLAGQLLQLGGPPWKYKVWEVVQLAPIEMLGGGRRGGDGGTIGTPGSRSSRLKSKSPRSRTEMKAAHPGHVFLSRSGFQQSAAVNIAPEVEEKEGAHLFSRGGEDERDSAALREQKQESFVENLLSEGAFGDFEAGATFAKEQEPPPPQPPRAVKKLRSSAAPLSPRAQPAGGDRFSQPQSVRESVVVPAQKKPAAKAKGKAKGNASGGLPVRTSAATATSANTRGSSVGPPARASAAEKEGPRPAGKGTSVSEQRMSSGGTYEQDLRSSTGLYVGPAARRTMEVPNSGYESTISSSAEQQEPPHPITEKLAAVMRNSAALAVNRDELMLRDHAGVTRSGGKGNASRQVAPVRVLPSTGIPGSNLGFSRAKLDKLSKTASTGGEQPGWEGKPAVRFFEDNPRTNESTLDPSSARPAASATSSQVPSLAKKSTGDFMMNSEIEMFLAEGTEDAPATQVPSWAKKSTSDFMMQDEIKMFLAPDAEMKNGSPPEQGPGQGTAASDAHAIPIARPNEEGKKKMVQKESSAASLRVGSGGSLLSPAGAQDVGDARPSAAEVAQAVAPSPLSETGTKSKDTSETPYCGPAIGAVSELLQGAGAFCGGDDHDSSWEVNKNGTGVAGVLESKAEKRQTEAVPARNMPTTYAADFIGQRGAPEEDQVREPDSSGIAIPAPDLGLAAQDDATSAASSSVRVPVAVPAAPSSPSPFPAVASSSTRARRNEGESAAQEIASGVEDEDHVASPDHCDAEAAAAEDVVSLGAAAAAGSGSSLDGDAAQEAEQTTSKASRTGLSASPASSRPPITPEKPPEGGHYTLDRDNLGQTSEEDAGDGNAHALEESHPLASSANDTTTRSPGPLAAVPAPDHSAGAPAANYAEAAVDADSVSQHVGQAADAHETRVFDATPYRVDAGGDEIENESELGLAPEHEIDSEPDHVPTQNPHLFYGDPGEDKEDGGGGSPTAPSSPGASVGGAASPAGQADVEAPPRNFLTNLYGEEIRVATSGGSGRKLPVFEKFGSVVGANSERSKSSSPGPASPQLPQGGSTSDAADEAFALGEAVDGTLEQEHTPRWKKNAKGEWVHLAARDPRHAPSVFVREGGSRSSSKGQQQLSGLIGPEGGLISKVTARRLAQQQQIQMERAAAAEEAAPFGADATTSNEAEDETDFKPGDFRPTRELQQKEKGPRLSVQKRVSKTNVHGWHIDATSLLDLPHATMLGMLNAWHAVTKTSRSPTSRPLVEKDKVLEQKVSSKALLLEGAPHPGGGRIAVPVRAEGSVDQRRFELPKQEQVDVNASLQSGVSEPGEHVEAVDMVGLKAENQRASSKSSHDHDHEQSLLETVWAVMRGDTAIHGVKKAASSKTALQPPQQKQDDAHENAPHVELQLQEQAPLEGDRAEEARARYREMMQQTVRSLLSVAETEMEGASAAEIHERKQQLFKELRTSYIYQTPDTDEEDEHFLYQQQHALGLLPGMVSAKDVEARAYAYHNPLQLRLMANESWADDPVVDPSDLVYKPPPLSCATHVSKLSLKRINMEMEGVAGTGAAVRAAGASGSCAMSPGGQSTRSQPASAQHMLNADLRGGGRNKNNLPKHLSGAALAEKMKMKKASPPGGLAQKRGRSPPAGTAFYAEDDFSPGRGHMTAYSAYEPSLRGYVETPQMDKKVRALLAASAPTSPMTWKKNKDGTYSKSERSWRNKNAKKASPSWPTEAFGAKAKSTGPAPSSSRSGRGGGKKLPSSGTLYSPLNDSNFNYVPVSRTDRRPRGDEDGVLLGKFQKVHKDLQRAPNMKDRAPRIEGSAVVARSPSSHTHSLQEEQSLSRHGFSSKSISKSKSSRGSRSRSPSIQRGSERGVGVETEAQTEVSWIAVSMSPRSVIQRSLFHDGMQNQINHDRHAHPVVRDDGGRVLLPSQVLAREKAARAAQARGASSSRSVSASVSPPPGADIEAKSQDEAESAKKRPDPAAYHGMNIISMLRKQEVTKHLEERKRDQLLTGKHGAPGKALSSRSRARAKHEEESAGRYLREEDPRLQLLRDDDVVAGEDEYAVESESKPTLIYDRIYLDHLLEDEQDAAFDSPDRRQTTASSTKKNMKNRTPPAAGKFGTRNSHALQRFSAYQRERGARRAREVEMEASDEEQDPHREEVEHEVVESSVQEHPEPSLPVPPPRDVAGQDLVDRNQEERDELQSRRPAATADVHVEGGLVVPIANAINLEPTTPAAAGEEPTKAQMNDTAGIVDEHDDDHDVSDRGDEAGSASPVSVSSLKKLFEHKTEQHEIEQRKFSPPAAPKIPKAPRTTPPEGPPSDPTAVLSAPASKAAPGPGASATASQDDRKVRRPSAVDNPVPGNLVQDETPAGAGLQHRRSAPMIIKRVSRASLQLTPVEKVQGPPEKDQQYLDGLRDDYTDDDVRAAKASVDRMLGGPPVLPANAAAVSPPAAVNINDDELADVRRKYQQKPRPPEILSKAGAPSTAAGERQTRQERSVDAVQELELQARALESAATTTNTMAPGASATAKSGGGDGGATSSEDSRLSFTDVLSVKKNDIKGGLFAEQHAAHPFRNPRGAKAEGEAAAPAEHEDEDDRAAERRPHHHHHYHHHRDHYAAQAAAGVGPSAGPNSVVTRQRSNSSKELDEGSATSGESGLETPSSEPRSGSSVHVENVQEGASSSSSAPGEKGERHH